MLAFQDQMKSNHCFGCGADNGSGLQIKSYWTDNDTAAQSYCDFHAAAHHNAGVTHYVNGGIISTVMDCHTICTAMADGYRREQRAMGEGETIWYVTGRLLVNYLKPVPIASNCRFLANIDNVSGKKTTLSGQLMIGDVCYATAEVLAIRVSEAWLNPQDK